MAPDEVALVLEAEHATAEGDLRAQRGDRVGGLVGGRRGHRAMMIAGGRGRRVPRSAGTGRSSCSRWSARQTGWRAALQRREVCGANQRFVAKRPNPKVELTAAGRERIAAHWERLWRLKAFCLVPVPKPARGRRR
jgi:hypothetical protein